MNGLPTLARSLTRPRGLDLQGNLIKEYGSVLPAAVLARISELSYEFMSYPEDLPNLGLKYYGAHIENGA